MSGLQSLLCLFWLGSVQAGKLLVIPADGSHWTGMKPLVEELGRRGNQVVVVIPEESLSMGPSEHTTTLRFPVPHTKAQIQERMSSRMEDILNIDKSTDLSRFIYFVFSLDFLKTFTLKNAESLLNNEELMKTLKDWDFDAVLTDPFEPQGAIIGEFLNIPSIYMQVNHPCDVDFLASQCPSPASYAPHKYTHYSDRMSFWQRTLNMVRALLQPLACRHLFSHADEIASRFLQRETSMMEIMSRADLWLMLSDFVFEFSRPVMPNMVMIGGLSHSKIHALPQLLQLTVKPHSYVFPCVVYGSSELNHREQYPPGRVSKAEQIWSEDPD
ncbi:UDP-glucuronosyltransferase 1A1-like [Pygocentrus nattereri]|uniref:UDP-glucuronosyltransferase 1A1-like n=1 Tax=Pygocentrus nattereri TaxID=42514 RepID=UPI001890C324|nr:UDP-glucuronosyltransferase 1A1-like [Pygocentrus nattereri]